jgi:hypothetical protein
MPCFKTVALLVAIGLLGSSCSGVRFLHDMGDVARGVTVFLVVIALIGSVCVDVCIERRTKRSASLLPPNLEQVARAHFVPSTRPLAENNQDSRIQQPGESSPAQDQPEEV